MVCIVEWLVLFRTSKEDALPSLARDGEDLVDEGCDTFGTELSLRELAVLLAPAVRLEDIARQ